MVKTYEITSLKDILDIPQDRIDDFMVELRVWYDVAHATKELLDSAAASLDLPGSAEAIGRMRWIDDGKSDIKINIEAVPDHDA